jgi:hypothetical protein
MHSNLLDFMSDIGNPVFSNITGAYFDNNISEPILMSIFLNKTSTIVFPIDYDYVALTYAVVAFAVGFFIIIPAGIILGVLWYRRRKKR